MRYVYLLLFVLVLALPFALRHAAFPSDEGQSPGTGVLARLVIVTPHNGDIRREFGRAFDSWYRQHYGQGVAVDFRVPGGTSDLVRLVTTSYESYRQNGKLPATVPVGFDLIWGGGDYAYYHQLQPLGVLQPIRIDRALLRAAFPDASLAGLRLYDATKDSEGVPTPQWIGVCLSSFGIIYNPELYETLQLSRPQHWADLTDPRLFGLIALADPSHSGSAAVSYMMVIQRAMADAEEQFLLADPDLKQLPRAELRKNLAYQQAIAAGWHQGMGRLLLIAANARYFTDSSEVVPTDVGRGEAAAGMAIDFYARVTEGTVGPQRARFVSPRAATAITPDSIAIPYGFSGERLVLATRFIEFLLSREAQRLWTLEPGQPGGPIERSPRRMPIRRDVYADQTGWADHFDPFDEAGNFNQRGDWMALMSDTLPIWAAAWIDSRDALVASYQQILQVKGPVRRSALLAALADLPVTMHDVEQDRSARTHLEQTHGDVDEWRARNRIRWSKRFREHDEQVAVQARGIP